MLVPLFVGDRRALRPPRRACSARRRHTTPRSRPAHKNLEPALETPVTVVTVIAAGDPRLGDRARRRARARAGAVPPPGPRDGRHGRLPDPPADDRAGAARRAAVAGIEARTLALGGAFTAVIFGLAAQQTLGNLIAGTVLLSARPFRVGERVRLQGGPLAGQLEGTVSSLGLLYTTFATGEDSIMVPNSVVLNVAVLPLREPEARQPARAAARRDDARRPAGDPRAHAADAAARLAADHARGARRRGGRRADRRHPARRARAASSRANCSVVSRETRAGANVDGDGRVARAPPGAAGRAPHAPRSAGTGTSRSRSAPSSSSATGGSSSAPGEDPQRLAAASARRRRASARATRNSSSTSPAASSCACEVRSALAQQRAHAEAPAQLARSPPAGRARRRARARTYSTCAAELGQARRGGGQDHHARRGLAQQRDVLAEREASRDDARERLGAQPARARAAPAALGSREHPPVALGAHRARADQHGVDGGAQRVEELAVGGAADRPRAPVERRAAVGGARPC